MAINITVCTTSWAYSSYFYYIKLNIVYNMFVTHYCGMMKLSVVYGYLSRL